LKSLILRILSICVGKRANRQKFPPGTRIIVAVVSWPTDAILGSLMPSGAETTNRRLAKTAIRSWKQLFVE
jgi:hypothetical protein